RAALVARRRPSATSATISKPATSGARFAIGGTPLFGSPGMVLPVTCDLAVSFAATGSTGDETDRVATFVTFVVPVTVAVICRVAVAPFARTPMSQTPVPGV